MILTAATYDLLHTLATREIDLDDTTCDTFNELYADGLVSGGGEGELPTVTDYGWAALDEYETNTGIIEEG